MTREQWIAIKTRDAAWDGVFYYALKNRKTICRPSCSARSCEPRQVLIFTTMEDATAQGFHPCQRCRPDLPEWHGAKQELAKSAKQLVGTHYRDKFSLEFYARLLFVNKSYLARVFKEVTGETLLSYHNRVRCREARVLLEELTLPIAQIGARVGYPSASHFIRIFKQQVGCTPREYQNRYVRQLQQEIE